MSQSKEIHDVVAQLAGQRCEGADNPYGSILSVDLGPLGLRRGEESGAKQHGWRHLTVLSPWRLHTDREVVADWNVEGGAGGPLPALVKQLVGDVVMAADTSGPAWDLRLTWKSGLTLCVFSDSTDDRDDAWFILGTDGIEVSAAPEFGAQKA
jgi:hypothetical protein